jgi:hypothetical protein
MDMTAFVVGATLAFGGCGDDSTAPSMAEVAGTYEATSLTMAFAGGAPVDLLAAGAEATLALDVDGTAAGHLFVPGGDEGGADLEEDLTGTWTLNGNTVILSQSADTFLGDIPLTVSGGRLVGDRTFSGVRIRITLTRQ